VWRPDCHHTFRMTLVVLLFDPFDMSCQEVREREGGKHPDIPTHHSFSCTEVKRTTRQADKEPCSGNFHRETGSRETARQEQRESALSAEINGIK